MDPQSLTQKAGSPASNPGKGFRREPFWRRALRLAGGGAAASAAAYWGISFLAASILARPRRRIANGISPALYGLESQDVRFPARGGDAEIFGWFIPCEASRRAVVLVHGKDVSRALEMYGRFLELAQALHRRGFTVLMIDLRGHGFSGPGTFGFGLNERRDVLGAVDWLEGQGFPPERTGVLGVSLGSSAVLGAAADEPRIGAVVSDSGFADIMPLMKTRFSRESHMPAFFLPGIIWAAWVMYGFDLSASRPVDEVGNIRGALLLVHGTQDTFIPPEHALRLKEAAPRAELWMVPGAVHAGCYGADPRGYRERVVRFLEAALKV